MCVCPSISLASPTRTQPLVAAFSVYIGGENWNNLFCLRRNKAASAEEIRCRLDTIGEFHLGEMCNKFMSGSLVMPVSSNTSSGNNSSNRRAARRAATPQKKRSESSPKNAAATGSTSAETAAASSRVRRPVVVTGSQTLFGTVDGTLGVILGLDGRTAAFFSTLERAMAKTIRPVGDFDHQLYRACQTERRIHPAHGFVDGDMVESFLDLDRGTMDAVVKEMNRDGGYEVDDAIAVVRTTTADARGGNSNSNTDAAAAAAETGSPPPELSVDDVLAMVEEITMLH
jgi:DNA damage-binding protein 1